MPKKNKPEGMTEFTCKQAITHEKMSLLTQELCVEMPADAHDPLAAAVALFNVKYHGETIRVWYTHGDIVNYKMTLQWDLGKLAYKLLTFDASGTREFESFDIEQLLKFSEFKPPVAFIYSNAAEWDTNGREKLEALFKEHPPKNFRVHTEFLTDRKIVRYRFAECAKNGRALKAAPVTNADGV
jgi:hypothetical protein